ncbi:MAG: hypothetical protein WDZ96_03780 [Acidimicrobiia bacterium]
MSEQRMDKYRADAERYRLAERPDRISDRMLAAVQTALDRSGLRRVGEILAGTQSRPIQPAI